MSSPIPALADNPQAIRLIRLSLDGADLNGEIATAPEWVRPMLTTLNGLDTEGRQNAFKQWLITRPDKTAIADAIDACDVNAPIEEDPEVPGGEPGPSGVEKPTVELTTDQHKVCSQVESILAQDESLFERNGKWVETIRASVPGKELIEFATGSPRIVQLQSSVIARAICKNMGLVRYHRQAEEFRAADPPPWLSKMVCDRPPATARPLMGISETPILRKDGSICSQAGYDPESGYCFDPGDGMEHVRVPSHPTREDAKRAAQTLLELVGDFPFVDECDKAAWLAALLTGVARHIVDAPVPLFILTANCPGTGKTKLTDLIGIIASGRSMPRCAWPDDDEEVRKSLVAIALAGLRFVLFDNLPSGHLSGSPNLDAALTGRSIAGRILGKSEMSGELIFDAITFMTGNNLGTRADTLRRVIPIRLETNEEKPEERSDFQVQGDLLAHALARRAELVGAALTILSAYLRAGSPITSGLKPMDYPVWIAIIRGAVYWSTGEDAAEGRESLAAGDETMAEAMALVSGLAELFLRTNSTWLKPADIIDHVKDQKDSFAVEGVLRGFDRRGELPTPKTIGKHLQKHSNRVISGKKLVSRVLDGRKEWGVINVK